MPLLLISRYDFAGESGRLGLKHDRSDNVKRSKTRAYRHDGLLGARWRERMEGERLHHLIRATVRALTRSFQMRLGEHSVAFGQWRFFCVLWETDGLTQRELSDQVGVKEPTTVATLRGMEKLGYIQRQHKPDNKRKMYIYLTPKGRLLKNKIVPMAVEVNDVAVQDISVADIAATRRTLLAMIENLVHDEARSVEQRRRVLSTRELARIISGEVRRPRIRATSNL
jgi:DNA-binding MarR family transcriptional regulator